MVLSCCHRRETTPLKNKAAIIWKNQLAPRGGLSQKRMLKLELKGRRRTLRVWENRLKMFNGLQQWIGLRTGRRHLPLAQPGANHIQLLTQFAPQPIHRFQREGQPQFFRRRLERTARQQPDQQLPKQRGGKSVARQNLGQTKGKRASTTAALPTIGTKDPLAAPHLAIGSYRVIAMKKAVPVQRADSFAVRARPLLEQKSCVFSSRSSRTKQKSDCGIRPCCLNPTGFVQLFYGTADGATRLIRIIAKGETALNGTLAAVGS